MYTDSMSVTVDRITNSYIGNLILLSVFPSFYPSCFTIIIITDPSCLSIYNGCYTEDCVCKCQSARKEIDTKTDKINTVTVTIFSNTSG